ncbi:MAG: MarR family transcriptional regulator [Deltaproteobacteria bacterium]|uniref:MarR family transcriptional regulator n=1 Tax=Candidatus Zymogenus saltonus TaxID=2844893 RepID=A0A9D8KCH2_9DELT|nr:MarR family transcriptional regulator [Candidatus Zymogenus saltonus]
MEITEKNIYYLISRLLDDFDKIKKDYSKRLLEEGYGVTASQIEMLGAIGQNPDISLGELATLTKLHITTVEGYVNRLSKKGLVEKRRDQDDTRRMLARLTLSGEQVAKATPIGYRAKLFEELKSIPLSEKEEIYNVLKKMIFLMR